MQKPPVPRERKAPSKYMQEIARMNFVEFIARVDKHQKAARIEALRQVRRNLASKFMTVYRAFRAKKYGDDFDRTAPYVWPKDKKARDPLLGELEDLDDGRPIPEEELVALEEAGLIREEVESLPEPCRAVLLMLFYEEQPPSYAEVAARIGRATGSIGSARLRCLADLGERLERRGLR